MAIYYDIQPDDLEPIEFTHFDEWESEESFNDVITSWESNLNLTLSRGSMDLAVLDILKSGLYDVYQGDSFIEIYKAKGE